MKTNQLKLFSAFVSNKQKQFEDNYFYVYYIASPMQYNSNYYANRVEVPLYIVKINKKTEEQIDLHQFKVDWTAINNFQLGQRVNPDGTYTLLEHTDSGFEDPIRTNIIHIPNPKIYQVRTLIDFLTQTNSKYFKYLFKIKNLHKELIYTYKDQNNQDVHIPAMEALRHFYVDSISTTLLDNVLKPDAMLKSKMFREFKKIEVPAGFSEAYWLLMDKETKKKDIYKLFYFLYYPSFTYMFNNVSMQWYKKSIIEAPIPINKPLVIKARHFKSGDSTLVLSIYKSTLLKFDKNIFLSYQHPNDYDGKDDTGNRDENHDFNQKVSNPDGSVDTKEKPDKSTPSFRAFREETLYDEFFPAEGIHADSVPVGKQEDRGGKAKIKFNENGKVTTIPQDETTGSDGATNLEDDAGTVTEEPIGPTPVELFESHNIKGIIEHLLDLNCSIENCQSYLFRLPDCSELKKNDDGSVEHCHKAQAYVHVKLKILRKYTVFKVITKENCSFFCLDVEPKGKAKHMLILFSKEEFTFFVNEVIDDLVFKQVEKGNHLWLKSGTLPNYTTGFKRISHTGDTESMANKILNTLD